MIVDDSANLVLVTGVITVDLQPAVADNIDQTFNKNDDDLSDGDMESDASDENDEE